jgi:solute:Na+ symporter, SSS family
MYLHPVDLVIVVAYLTASIWIGFYRSKRAASDTETYFLSGKKLSWRILGISDASGMFDITGTMWMVSMMFIYGVKSAWLTWIWPVFNQIFLMVYLSRWLRRSEVPTGAAWMHFRFGQSRAAEWAHLMVVLYALVSVVSFLAYGFKGIGKFAAAFLPFAFSTSPEMNALCYATLLSALTALYVVRGGMYSVVFTEVAQFVVLTLASIAVGVVAMQRVSPEMIAQHTPEGWQSLRFGWTLDIDWSGLLDGMNKHIENNGILHFGWFMTLALFKGIFASAAGPAPNYDMQRILAARNPEDAARISFFVNIVLYFPRYMLITGLAVLAVGFFIPQLNAMGDKLDVELILPYILKDCLPVGVLGLILAGLIAAYMSNFAATVNAAPAYMVNDIYRKYINPRASERRLVSVGQWSSLGVIVVGIAFSFMADSIDAIMQWTFAALWGGYTAANVLKWYWWRFNAYGYCWGMAIGIATSMIAPFLTPEWSPLERFPAIFGLSILGCVLASMLTPPDAPQVLENFYMKTRPWGFWRPVKMRILEKMPDFEQESYFWIDLRNIVIGMVWQMSLIALPIFFVLRRWEAFSLVLIVLALTSVSLKYWWWDRLRNRL